MAIRTVKIGLEGSKNKAKKLKNYYEEVEEILYYQRLLFMLKAIQIKLISSQHSNLLIDYFCNNKIKKLISQKYYLLGVKKNVKAYIKGYNVCLSFKMVR